ncbi:T9SS type A sorting domain-containing protein [Chitinophaga nivalis]|uniref:T9SS type A sorting domain-containing protein n=1 Tax=Chitinophaga nivalis TaxID=2991709 RepID=A0ABT3IIW3_9BACT|nr:T9SS type A sorting domain-containing protein [Chitinophaga nivalis]MCW3466625.1 T9SS type A sorting domain-containing protein [Chitinophaga nivalis]MCW3483684.1 T9SS type A sorting domain-containing protein [Chitinophaga nivalis]
MKISTYPLTVAGLLCLLVTSSLLLFSSGKASAQKIYASSQANQVNGLCLICGVADPNNAVGSNENDYSTFNISLGLPGVSVEQTLIFPSASTGSCDSLFVGIGSGNALLSVSLFGGVTVQTWNGNTPNNDLRVLSADIVRLLNNNTRAEIHLKPGVAFDRVKLTLNSGLLGLLQNFRLYYASKRTITPPPTPVITPAASGIYRGESVTLSVSPITGTSIFWYSSRTGVNAIALGNSYVATPDSSTTYAALALRDGCPSPLGFATVIVAQHRPAAPNASSLSTEDIAGKQTLQVFPNPTTGLLQINGEKNLSGGIITLIDLQGKTLFRQPLRSNTIQLPTSIPEGTYLLQVYTTDHRRLATKIVINR